MDEYNPITQIDYLKEHIEALKKELSEKEAMIDWLAGELFDRDKDYTADCPGYWIRKAQEAVKKNDSKE